MQKMQSNIHLQPPAPQEEHIARVENNLQSTREKRVIC